jgi:hypothetical protein
MMRGACLGMRVVLLAAMAPGYLFDPALAAWEPMPQHLQVLRTLAMFGVCVSAVCNSHHGHK